MSEQRNNTPAPITERLLTQPRRTAGMDSHREPVRLGEIGSDGHLVGYIDEHGLAWESLKGASSPFTAPASPKRSPCLTTTRGETSSSIKSWPMSPTNSSPRSPEKPPASSTSVTLDPEAPEPRGGQKGSLREPGPLYTQRWPAP